MTDNNLSNAVLNAFEYMLIARQRASGRIESHMITSIILKDAGRAEEVAEEPAPRLLDVEVEAFIKALNDYGYDVVPKGDNSG